MKTYIILLQIGATNFLIKEYNAATIDSLYPLYKNIGIAIAIHEKKVDTLKYLEIIKAECEKLAKESY